MCSFTAPFLSGVGVTLVELGEKGNDWIHQTEKALDGILKPLDSDMWLVNVGVVAGAFL